MKTLLIGILIVIVAGIIFLFGNSIRCMYAVGSCPYMCKQIKIDCSGRFDARCQSGGNVCQGLSTTEYYDKLQRLINIR